MLQVHWGLPAAAWHRAAAGTAAPSTAESSGRGQRVPKGPPQAPWGRRARAAAPHDPTVRGDAAGGLRIGLWQAGGSPGPGPGLLRAGGGPGPLRAASPGAHSARERQRRCLPRLAGAGQGGGRCRRFPVARYGPGRARNHERLRPGGAQPGVGGGPAAGGRAGLGSGQGFLRQSGYPEAPAGECGARGSGGRLGARGEAGGPRAAGRRYPALAPQPKPQNAITVAVSSRALFNLVEEQRIYEEQGVEKYVEYQQKNENIILKPGPAFYFVKVARRRPGAGGSAGRERVWVRRSTEDAARPNFGKRRSPKPPSPEVILPREMLWELFSQRRVRRGGAGREHSPHLSELPGPAATASLPFPIPSPPLLPSPPAGSNAERLRQSTYCSRHRDRSGTLSIPVCIPAHSTTSQVWVRSSLLFLLDMGHMKPLSF